MAKKHPLFCTKDVFQTPVGLINRSTDQKRFQTSLSEHVAPVTTVAQMNRYIIEAVTILGPAIVKGDTDNKLVSLAYGPSNSENCLDLVAEVDDPSGGCIIAQLVIPVDTSVQGFEALGKEAHIAAMRVTANGTQEPLPSIPSVSTKEAPFSLLAMYMLIAMTLHVWDGEFCENLHLVTAKNHMDGTPASKEEMETA